MHHGNIYLTGFMGAGKTTLGGALAKLLGWRFVDLDDRVVKRFGHSVAEIFANRGEPAFREAESAELHRVSRKSHLVVATGGGLPADPANRHLLRASGRVVCLMASLATCRAHLGPAGVKGRPLWREPQALAEIYARRQEAYADCDLCLAVDGKTPEALLIELIEGLAPEQAWPLNLGGGQCQIISTWRAPQALAGLAQGRRVAIITDRHLEALHLPRHLAESGLAPAAVVSLAPGETSKSLASAKRVYETLLKARVERGDLIVGLGGGVVTDLAGFVASTFKRGVDFVLAATSLVAAVDAAVGGKTAVNLPGAKNVVGAFAAPRAVLLDRLALATLPRPQIAEGLVEAYKTGLVAEPALAELVQHDLKALKAGDLLGLVEAARLSALAKSRVVGEDFREKGLRRVLNLGHTYGHALEAHNRYRVSHGQAVAAGLMLAARVSQGRGWLNPRLADDICTTAQGLIAHKLAWPDAATAWELMANDKKNQGGRVVFVLLAGLGQTRIADDVTPAEIAKALDALGVAGHG
ncbi:MAG: bifunctional shikimate kinase/3-dehydroquinate synthase [Thermodesulfobacteriota bacterium]